MLKLPHLQKARELVLQLIEQKEMEVCSTMSMVHMTVNHFFLPCIFIGLLVNFSLPHPNNHCSYSVCSQGAL